MRYRTKAFEIEAELFTGGNLAEIQAFCGVRTVDRHDIPIFDVAENWIVEHRRSPEIVAAVYDKLHESWVGVKAGQYIIRGMKNEYYPCDAEVFNTKYEPVE